MFTPIEEFLCKQGGAYGLVEIAQSANRLVLTVAPWADLASVKVAVFADMKILSVEVYSDNLDDLNLPSDIIGFDSHPMPKSRWKFVLHCSGIEYVFESRWPHEQEAK
jgi:hypothetical protein